MRLPSPNVEMRAAFFKEIPGLPGLLVKTEERKVFAPQFWGMPPKNWAPS
jgi:hypothetical protein